MIKTKILVVEDESIIAKDLQTILTEAGYEVPYTASNSKDALKYTEDLMPDLILMDVIIQGPVDGITTAQIINHLYDIPIIFLSAYSDKNTLDRARSVGSFGYLLKPCDERELLIAVDFGLQKARIDRLLKAQNRLFTAVICNIASGAIVVNNDNKIELVNPQAQAILGWKDADLHKKPIQELIQGYDSILQPGKDEFQGPFINKKDAPITLNFKTIPLRDNDNKPTGTLIYVSWVKAKENKKAS